MLEDPRNNSLRTPAPKAPVTSALELAALSLLVLAPHLPTHIPNPGSASSAWLAVNVIPSVPAALLIVSMAMNCGLINRVPSFPVAVFLWEISYSVYLLHGLIVYVLFFRPPQMSPAQMSAAHIATLLVAAAASWYFVERPAVLRSLLESGIVGQSNAPAGGMHPQTWPPGSRGPGY
jgi:peptidoglycan/LPS O-acetylase OafA/YrhL